MKVSAENTVLSCEHASHRIPAAYRHLFKEYNHLLISHRGWDPGAHECATQLSKQLHVPLIKGSCNRLVVDLNRSLHHRHAFSEFTRTLPKPVRQAIINRIYLPYREQLRQAIVRRIAKHGFVLHLSLHSFSPVMKGSQRRADIGLLYDPRRKFEKAIAASLQLRLAELDPELTIRRNYPYRGAADGATTQYRRDLSGRFYAGLEIEINQKYPLAGDPSQWRRLRNNIVLAVQSVVRAT